MSEVVPGHAQVRHNETILVTRNGNVYHVELGTTTSIDHISLDDHVKGQQMTFLHPLDAFLVNAIQKHSIQSLTLSVSSSSNKDGIGFPVGTAVQFRLRNQTGDDTFFQDQDMKHGMDDEKLVYDLMLILSHKNMLCETAQLEPLYSNRNMRATPLGDGSYIIMIPNDAYSLCHSKAFMDQVMSAAPCHTTAGIYSQLENSRLLGIDIVHKSSWMDLQMLGDGQIQIQKGLRYDRMIMNKNENVSPSQLLLGGKGDFLYHCPLVDNSRFILHGKDGNINYDLKTHPLDMKQRFQVKSEKGSSFSIQKSNVRLNGISNKGKLITRVYVGNMQGNAKCANADDVHVNVVDTYPSFIYPIYHSLKLLLVQGKGAGDENFVLSTAMSPTSNFTIRELSMHDIKHDFSLESDKSGTISISTRMPRHSSLYMELDYNPRYLGFESFSSDPNRGFDLMPSIGTFSCHVDGVFMLSSRYFSNSLVIMPPVPDLSMPYNVISLYSTFCALIIGTTINLTIKKSREKVKDQLNGKVEKKSKKELIREKLRKVMSIFPRGRKMRPTCLEENTVGDDDKAKLD